MNRIFKSFVYLCICVFISGCDNDARLSEVKETITENPSVEAEAACDNSNALTQNQIQTNTEAVVLCVNDLAVTKEQYQEYVAMMMALYRNKNTKCDKKAMDAMSERLKSGAVKYLIQRLIFKSTLADVKIAEKDGIRSRIEKDYVKMFSPPKETFDQLKAKMIAAGKGEIFLQDYELDVRLNSYIETEFADQLALTDEELIGVKQDVMEYNQRAAATNMLTEALGSELVRRARAGEDFGKLADTYSMDSEKEDGGRMGQCVESDFLDESPSYWKTLNRLQAGDISDLIETSVGYEIVRVDARLSADESDSGMPALELSRIFLRRAYEFEEQTDEEFKQDVIREKREKVLQTFFSQQRKKSKVMFPLGKAALFK